MNDFNRRAFMGLSVGALSMLRDPTAALAQSACVTGGLPSFTPTRLTVDCASKKNFSIWRKNTDYMGLTGVVSMSYVTGKWGSYTAGNLFLFPWLKTKGQALGATKDWGSVYPTSATATAVRAPIGGWTLPLDEYFVRLVLQAPQASFIGFRVDTPFGINDARRPWFTNSAKLADGLPVGVAWNSSNLNGAWFGGSRWIPNQDACSGNAWRKVILDGLSQASAGACVVAAPPPIRVLR